MLKLIKWLLIILASLAIAGSAFAFYTYFLVDYSLESLETALAATETVPDQASSVADHIYRNIVDDMALREVASNNMDLKNLVMTETASRSLDETLDRKGGKRAKIYLNEIVKRKKINQPRILQFRSFLQTQTAKILNFINSFFKFFRKNILQGNAKGESSIEGARFIFLSKTQKLEKEGKYKEAVERYRQYLKRYPESPDKGFVSISLSYGLIKDGRLREAERILKDVQSLYAGKIESRVASQVLAQISDMDKNGQKIEVLRQRRAAGGAGDSQRNVDFELAALYSSLYRFSDAEPIFKQLAAGDDLLSIKSSFKLGWIYKNTNRLKDAEKVFSELLRRKELPVDLELGIHGELADIYYKQKNSAKALEHYKKLTANAEREGSSADGVWATLSAYEQANIYNFDLKDKSKADEQIQQVGKLFMDETQDSRLNDNFFDDTSADLRTQAFRAMRSRRMGMAYELFNRYLVNNPADAWSLAGLSTVSLMMGDFKESAEYAKQAYAAQPDEYTSSMMAYIYGVKHEYSSAEAIYEKALQMNPDYLPAKFNLACMKIRRKKYDQAFDLLNGMVNKGKLSSIMKAKIYNNLGFIYWQLGKQKDALENFEKAVKIEPGYVIAVKNVNRIILKASGQSAHEETLEQQKV